MSPVISSLFLGLLAFCLKKCLSEGDSSNQTVPALIRSFPTKSVADPKKKFVALTFDDGPHKVLTPRLLDVLKDKNAKATFFVMGIKAIMHPTIVKRAHQEGHEIANHAWNHPVMTKISREELSQQLKSTSEAIFNATGAHPKIMRPPYGNTNPDVNNFIYENEHLNVILWSLDTRDWMRPGKEAVISRAVSGSAQGTVILCHDIHPGTIEAIPSIIDSLHKAGFEFKTVSEMASLFYPSNAAATPSGGKRHLRGIGAST